LLPTVGLSDHNIIFTTLDTILNEETKRYYKENGVRDIDKFVNKKLEQYTEVKVQVAITGDSGAGKSAFINAIRG
jgi:putative ribosome biogenesis GTPase RsgA